MKSYLHVALGGDIWSYVDSSEMMVAARVSEVKAVEKRRTLVRVNKLLEASVTKSLLHVRRIWPYLVAVL